MTRWQGSLLILAVLSLGLSGTLRVAATVALLVLLIALMRSDDVSGP